MGSGSPVNATFRRLHEQHLSQSLLHIFLLLFWTLSLRHYGDWQHQEFWDIYNIGKEDQYFALAAWTKIHTVNNIITIMFTIFPVLLIRNDNLYLDNYTLDLDQSWKGKLKIHLRPKVPHLMHTAYNLELSNKITPQISLFSSSTNLWNNVRLGIYITHNFSLAC